MALTFSNIGTAVITTSSSSLTESLTSNVNANEWLIVCVAADNSGTSGAISLSSILTDSANNFYSLQSLTNTTSGASSDGTTLGIWISRITNPLISGTITATFSPNVSAAAMTIKKIVIEANEWINIVNVASGFSGINGTSFTSSAISVTNGYTILGATAIEQSTAPTADSDTTNGSWSTAYTASASTGTNTGSQSISSQQKTVTATGNQTYNTSSGTARDWAVNTIILAPIITKQILSVT